MNSRSSTTMLPTQDTFSERMKRLGKEVYKARESYVLIAPFMIIFILFTLVPVVISIILSFTYYNILEAPQWIGWLNYINLFLRDEVFVIAVQNTFLFALITGPIGYLLALLFAWMINELKPKIRAVFVVIFYAPTLSYSIWTIFKFFFSGDAYGWLNAFLLDMGIIQIPINWLYNPDYIRPIIIIVTLWTSLGYGFLAFVAGLQGIDKALYEAGAIDGIKNRWQELWYITLPSMKPQLMFGAVMSITNSFIQQYQIMNLVGFPSTDYAGRTLMSHLQDYGYTRFDMGYASAIATLMFFTMIYLNRIIQKILRKVGT